MLICDYETINAFVGTNNALNTFYLQCVRNMVKDHSYSEIGNQLSSLHGLLFLISSKGFFICTIYRQNNTYHNIVTPVGMRNSSLSPMRDQSDPLHTFYLLLYGIRHMVEDHSDSERGNPLPPHRLLFPISREGSFICIRQGNTYHSLCYTSRGALVEQMQFTICTEIILSFGMYKWHHDRGIFRFSKMYVAHYSMLHFQGIVGW